MWNCEKSPNNKWRIEKTKKSTSSFLESTRKVEVLISIRVRKHANLQKNKISLDKHLASRLEKMGAYTGPPNPTLGQTKARNKIPK